jgi:hypothetical protein
MRLRQFIATIFCLTALLCLGCKDSEAPKTVSASALEAHSYTEPPTVDVGLNVEQAYAAIPHRRTVWSEADSTATPEEIAYLRVMFPLVDQAIALRVAAL